MPDVARATDSLEGASREFYRALNEVLAGDPEAMLELWSHEDDVTYMSPFGELLEGWAAVRSSWRGQAEAHLGGRVEPEGLRHVGTTGLGVVVGFERGTVEVDGKPTAVNIRATSTYRHADGRWQMIGHHTDPLG